MTTAREKIQIALGVAGLASVGMGLAFFNFGSSKEEAPTPLHRVGFWKDTGMTDDSEKKLAPWMLAGGATAITVAFIIRDK